MNKHLLPAFLALMFLCFQPFSSLSQTGDNLALDQPAFASSARDALPDSAFDGNQDTRWISDYSDPQWIYVDLGGSYPIKRVHIVWDTTYAVDYQLQVSDDEDNWITVQTVTGNPSLDNDLTNLNAAGRFVRIYATARGNTSSSNLYGYAIRELEVFSNEEPPVVSITSPENNTQHLYTTAPALTATIEASAADGKEVEKVELYHENTLIGVDTATPFTFSLAGLGEGTFALTAKVVDEENAVAYSDPIHVRLNKVTADPCNSPAWNNSTVYSEAGNLVTYLGRLYKNRWYTVGQDPLNHSGQFKAWELISTCSTPTTVNITTPETGAIYHALASINIHVDALATAPYRITKVDLFSGATLIDSDTSSSFSFNFNDVPAGSYTFTAVAYDDAGFSITSNPKTVQVLAGSGCNAPEWRGNIIYANIGEQVTYQGNVYQNKWYSHGQDPSTNSGQYQVWTLISTCAATAAITTPGDSAIYTSPASVTIDATASNPGGGITKLEFYQGASLLASDETAPYSFNWAGVAPGNYSLSVKAYTSAGVVATSPSVNVIVKALSGAFTWTGAGGDNDWNNPTNWTPNGIPGASDSVTIAAAAGLPRLNNNITLTDLTLQSDTLNLNGQQVMVTGIARFNGGFITNGTLNVQCSEAWFDGTTFDNNVLVQTTCSNIFLNGSVFNGRSYITKQGNEAQDNESDGGNTFNGAVNITNNTPFLLRMNNTTGDDFNDAATFSNSNTGIFDVAYNGNSSFAGNIIINSNSDISFGQGTGIITFDSSNVQTLSKAGLANIVFHRLVLNKTDNDLVLSGPMHINNNLTFINGRIQSVSEGPVVFNTGSTVTGAGNSNFVSGPVTRYGSGAFTFPVGKDNMYRPISIAPTGTPFDAFTAEYFRQTGPDVSSLAPEIHHVSTCEYWILDRTNGAAPTPVTLSWDNTSCGVTNPAELLVARWNGTVWVNEGNGAITGDANAGTITTSGELSSFSPFTLASSTLNNPLPVQWLSFTGTRESNGNLLKWSTATEFMNTGFTVERSADGDKFEKIGFVEGAGNSSSVRHYSLLDGAPVNGRNYYRVKQTDADGNFAYSKIISVDAITQQHHIRIMPNPARDKTTISLRLAGTQDCTMIISDIAGRVLSTKRLGPLSGGNIDVDLSTYTNGMYIVTIKTPNGLLHQEKLIKR